MVLVFGLHDVGETDEAQPAHVTVVQAAVVAARVGPIGHRAEVGGGQTRGQVVLPAIGHVVGDAGDIDSDGGRLVVCVGDDLDRVRVQVVVGDGCRRGVENGWDVIFSDDVARNGGGVRNMGGFLNVAFEDLTAGW